MKLQVEILLIVRLVLIHKKYFPIKDADEQEMRAHLVAPFSPSPPSKEERESGAVSRCARRVANALNPH